jgi:predicted RNA-binding Zn-ribbon protein involved in translation (DUF1610 family)
MRKRIRRNKNGEIDVALVGLVFFLVLAFGLMGLAFSTYHPAPYDPQDDIGGRLRDNVVYRCPNCGWTGMTGLMNGQPISNWREGCVELYCPTCGYHMGYNYP